jgi:hypothetical protein
MIGGLSAAATGALRALLDSAHISNVPDDAQAQGRHARRPVAEIQPTQVEEIEGGLNVDDVRKLAMPLPYNPPIAVLFPCSASWSTRQGRRPHVDGGHRRPEPERASRHDARR